MRVHAAATQPICSRQTLLRLTLKFPRVLVSCHGKTHDSDADAAFLQQCDRGLRECVWCVCVQA